MEDKDKQVKEETMEDKDKQVEEEIKKPLTPDELIADNMAYFNFYQSAPKVFTIVFAVLFSIASLLAAIELQNAGYFFLFLIGGAFLCFIVYFLLKLFFAHKILQIAYLIKIEENTKKNK